MIAAVSRHDHAGHVDPAELTSGEKAALGLVASSRLIRVRGGWQGRGTPKVSLLIAGRLQALGLIAVERAAHPYLALRPKGKITLAVIEQRRKRR